MGSTSLRWPVKELARRSRRRLRDCVPARVVLARRYQRTFYYRPPLVTTVADKYAVRS
jgi:hypothetical protein